MPVQGWYLDDETYRRLLEEAGKQARKPGEILSEIVRTELSKRESEENRPKFCTGLCSAVRKNDLYFETKPLEWHLTAQDQAELYCICPSCGWTYHTGEIFKTALLH